MSARAPRQQGAERPPNVSEAAPARTNGPAVTSTRVDRTARSGLPPPASAGGQEAAQESELRRQRPPDGQERRRDVEAGRGGGAGVRRNGFLELALPERAAAAEVLLEEGRAGGGGVLGHRGAEANASAGVGKRRSRKLVASLPALFSVLLRVRSKACRRFFLKGGEGKQWTFEEKEWED
ncbi:hypothetical protein GW17_00030388 [Ensete ventricosum]|nr:hypothetical protein GW17_00030388 [Ensete ventricosum]